MLGITEKQIKSTWGKEFTDFQVSICCITYNQEDYIADAIEGFLLQKTNFPFEIIIGDDGSKDTTRSIINSYAEKYPDLIKVINNVNNLGANANFLNVFRVSTGRYIATCEGDDYWIDEGKLQKQFDALQAHENVMFSFHPCLLQNGNHVSKRSAYDKGADSKICTMDDVLHSLNQFSPTASYMFSRDIIDTLPSWFSKAPVGDLFLELYGMHNAGGLYLPWAMSVYRLEAIGSWSTSTQAKRDIHQQRHLRLIECLDMAANDFPNKRVSFSRKIAHIYLALAVRAIKSDDVEGFVDYLNSANRHYRFLSVKHRLYNFAKKSPKAIRYALKLKNLKIKK